MANPAILPIVIFAIAKISWRFQTVERVLSAGYSKTARGLQHAGRHRSSVDILSENFFRKVTTIPKK
ncbi:MULTISPECIES: hypothetical protein [unclassified Agrobacterium]|uniref:hypothetical protein n=1 Tax=unclassified Agrobacterium TaxID=2632611 RepID=UPI00244BECE1|nr:MULTISPECIES: hypothetical protein [unclassified Agrobacterium]MDH0615886.1 hypothetical protein [Agrobacterium sp. GD03872]MDH0698001.1 hypothetical protein [Agrobacterium sp. GD03871]MDH1061086.1 hypothetical protein [Agrobacterium sp. GD03992]MDH2211882.1 hypothetical protein [Agrobacterium sp. GD03643]MDH2221274.1 hypothetical protein [Agrobacterium sp. GD03638]